MIISNQLFAQNDEAEETELIRKDKKGFYSGISVGSLFANKSTASLYDGYGYDFNGNKNNFCDFF